jgi:hypothetical protein
MFAVVRSVSKRQLASSAKVSPGTIPVTLAAANEMPDAKLRRLFEAASSLAEENRRIGKADELLIQWLVKQVSERGLKVLAEFLDYDAANLAKAVAGRRKISKDLRKPISERMVVKGTD